MTERTFLVLCSLAVLLLFSGILGCISPAVFVSVEGLGLYSTTQIAGDSAV